MCMDSRHMIFQLIHYSDIYFSKGASGYILKRKKQPFAIGLLINVSVMSHTLLLLQKQIPPDEAGGYRSKMLNYFFSAKTTSVKGPSRLLKSKLMREREF